MTKKNNKYRLPLAITTSAKPKPVGGGQNAASRQRVPCRDGSDHHHPLRVDGRNEHRDAGPLPNDRRPRGVHAGVIKLGYYSNSQNGLIVSRHGIAPCICGGGKGHDIDTVKILIEYE